MPPKKNSPPHYLDMNFTNTDELVSILPEYNPSGTHLVANKLPCHHAKIHRYTRIELEKLLNRDAWKEGLYVKESELRQVLRYKNQDGIYKHDFDDNQYLTWVRSIEENTVICDMENPIVGRGVFVPPHKILPEGTFIISSGIIKFQPTIEELQTKNHCSALQDLSTAKREIYGIIDPEIRGGVLDQINHAPDKVELSNFSFKAACNISDISISNLRSIIKFYHGFAIMGVEAIKDIDGGDYGCQLLWSYASPYEYQDPTEPYLSNKKILLFDSRYQHNGEVIDPSNYTLKLIDIYLDDGQLIPNKIGSITRWELMTAPAESHFTFSLRDIASYNLEAGQFSVKYRYLQAFLRSSPLSDRIILNVPGVDVNLRRA